MTSLNSPSPEAPELIQRHFAGLAGGTQPAGATLDRLEEGRFRVGHEAATINIGMHAILKHVKGLGRR